MDGEIRTTVQRLPAQRRFWVVLSLAISPFLPTPDNHKRQADQLADDDSSRPAKRIKSANDTYTSHDEALSDSESHVATPSGSALGSDKLPDDVTIEISPSSNRIRANVEELALLSTIVYDESIVEYLPSGSLPGCSRSLPQRSSHVHLERVIKDGAVE